MTASLHLDIKSQKFLRITLFEADYIRIVQRGSNLPFNSWCSRWRSTSSSTACLTSSLRSLAGALGRIVYLALVSYSI